MRWFRRKEQQAEPAVAKQAPAPEAQPEPEPVVEETAAAVSTAEKKRRRGTRGGRSRKKKPTETAAATAAPARQAKKAPRQTERPARAKRERDRERPQRRERRPQRRAPLPQAERELLVEVDITEQRVAVLEDGRVAEVYLERPERRSIAGNIYKGVVDNVLPGMEAAFVEIGLEKNGFLYVDEIVTPELEGRRARGSRRIQDLISRGEELLVQAVKDPMKTKGARLTTEISLPGRFVVYTPNGEGIGVSRRLDDDERNRLKEIVKDIAPKKGGVIVRTAAEGASAEDVERDLAFLQKLWKSIEAKAKASPAPALIFQEAELPLRVVRDLFTGDFARALVDEDRTLKRIQGYLKKTSPHMAERVSRYRDKTPLFESFGVDAEIRSTLSRRVDLPSGGYLIFDYAEAFTVIDVNTGRFVGSRSKTATQRLEDTVTKNNLEAVKEVVRQLRLRDIGGIIVIDFIDMANPKNRATVEEALRAELERDRTKTYVVEISPLGLVEMTRQNVTDGPREILTKKCPTCTGEGVVVSEATAVVEVERRLRALAASKPRTKAFRVELNAHVAELLIGPGATRLAAIEEGTKRRFYVDAREDVPHDHFIVVEEGTLEKLKPEAPIEEGQELDAKLVEVGRHDAAAGVAKLDGYLLCVAGAAKQVGKKVHVRVERVLDGVAYATLLDTAEEAAAPITAEAEAEKPTRAPARKKAAQPQAEPEAATPAEPAEPDAEDAEEAEEPEEAEEAEAAAAAPKKKSRRGTRGGRKRKKPAAASAEAAAANAPAEEPEPAPTPARATADQKKKTRRGTRGGRKRKKPATATTATAAAGGNGDAPSAPTIHVPEPGLSRSENGDEPAAPRKRTRRGSRGGRNRRKKPTAGVKGDSSPAEQSE